MNSLATVSIAVGRCYTQMHACCSAAPTAYTRVAVLSQLGHKLIAIGVLLTADSFVAQCDQLYALIQ